MISHESGEGEEARTAKAVFHKNCLNHRLTQIRGLRRLVIILTKEFTSYKMSKLWILKLLASIIMTEELFTQ